MHVLLIEPNTLLAASYTRALTHAGYTVSHVTTAQAAIDAADKMRPDVVVLELQLPAHSGIEFLHEFRSYAEWQHVPVILHTVLPPAQLARAERGLRFELGICAMLYKPRTTLAALLQTVRGQSSAKKTS